MAHPLLASSTTVPEPPRQNNHHSIMTSAIHNNNVAAAQTTAALAQNPFLSRILSLSSNKNQASSCAARRRYTTVVVIIMILSLISLQLGFHPENAVRLAFSVLPPQQQNDDNNNKIPVFYNLYIASPNDIPRVTKLMVEQFEYLLQVHDPIYIYSYGNGTRDWQNVTDHLAKAARHNNRTTALANNNKIVHARHADTGGERETLYQLWNYCRHQNNSNHRSVVYLHSKGSFHDMPANRHIRRFDTMGTLHRDCAAAAAAAMSSTTTQHHCNLCAARFSPLPHPHVPGNMWQADCAYIQQLYNPLHFQDAMEHVTKWHRRNDFDWAVGRNRHAYEHWVGSHPTLQPCDMYVKDDYVWGYGIVSNFVPEDFHIAPAPRFSQAQYQPNPTWWRGSSLDFRLAEYRALYHHHNNATTPMPDEHWWGWKFFANNNDNDTETATTAKATANTKG